MFQKLPAGSRTIVFTNTKRRVDKLAKMVWGEWGMGCCAIHGDKSQGERMEALAKFAAGEWPFMFATDVAARGLDIKGITHVLNYDIPRTLRDMCIASAVRGVPAQVEPRSPFGTPTSTPSAPLRSRRSHTTQGSLCRRGSTPWPSGWGRERRRGPRTTFDTPFPLWCSPSLDDGACYIDRSALPRGCTCLRGPPKDIDFARARSHLPQFVAPRNLASHHDHPHIVHEHVYVGGGAAVA